MLLYFSLFLSIIHSPPDCRSMPVWISHRECVTRNWINFRSTKLSLFHRECFTFMDINRIIIDKKYISTSSFQRICSLIAYFCSSCNFLGIVGTIWMVIFVYSWRRFHALLRIRIDSIEKKCNGKKLLHVLD